ncbi:MAG: dihydroneopterin aldolase [Bacteroidales bacterium]|nr:dihydroneopterin aldolase [Bacteroidales bacterium]
MKTTIRIDNIKFYAYHGVMEQEQIVGNQFSVSVTLEADVLEATLTDELSQTISYADVCNVIKIEMAIPSKLLEHVTGRIYRQLKISFPQITRLDVSVYKYNPPGCGETERAGVTLSDW